MLLSCMLMESLNDFFASIDEDGSGTITCDELAEAMRNMGQVAPQEDMTSF